MRQRSCETYRTLISALLDGDISPDEQVRLDDHLATCDDCRQILDDYRGISRSLRDLPAVSPPPDLARSIRQKTVDRPPDPRWVRWVGFASPKLGLSTIGALAILIVAFSFILVNGYQQSVAPAINGSSPSAQQDWPIYQPVRIAFNKPMNHASVQAGVRILPVGELARLPMSWDGDTLVIGSDGSHSELLLPDTNYTIVVLADVLDAHGNHLGSVWTLAFHTGPSTTALGQPIPTDAATAASTDTVQPTAPEASATPSSSVAFITPKTSQATNTQPSTSWQPNGTASTATSPTQSQARQTPQSHSMVPGQQTAQTQKTVTPKATTASNPAPSPSLAPQPTTTPATEITPEPTTVPQPTQVAIATATQVATDVATATATPTPTVPAAPSTAAATQPVTSVSGAFGSVYWANNDVQAKLGAPTQIDYAVSAQELGFQHGTMYERLDTSTIYSLLANGSWSSAKDSWVSGDPAGGGSCSGNNLFQPTDGFFKLWSNDSALKDAIGCANKSGATVEAGRVQEFQNGEMLYSEQGFVYVLYNDGTWKLYPDTSGHGSLLTPTPEPTTSATPAATATSTSTGTATPASTPAPTPAETATAQP